MSSEQKTKQDYQKKHCYLQRNVGVFPKDTYCSLMYSEIGYQ